jgi:hypothetical protein
MTDAPSMPRDTRELVYKLRCRSKRGETLAREEFKFLQRAMRQWPEEYAAMNTEIFVATAPFGSRL